MKAVVVVLLFAVVMCGAAPLLSANSPHVVRGSYIVILKTSEKHSRDEHILQLKDLIERKKDGSKVRHKYSIGSMVGFSARLTDSMLNSQLDHPNVAYIESDQKVKASYNYDKNATWGLARISEIKNKESTIYNYNSTAGSGVDVYVIDTGIFIEHKDFEGRAEFVFNAIDYENDQDLNGHGTHCAGTIGGATYGVAKKVSLKAVKVMDKYGSGTIESIVAGVDYVANQHSPSRPAVASMSLGGGGSKVLDSAVKGAIAKGVVFAVAAGNEDWDACGSSPARVPEAITVAATNKTDKRASFSNYGNCVNIFAPGVDITSTWIGSKTATNTISGTSMATPHVAGVLAMHLSDFPSLSPYQSSAWLYNTATQGMVKNPKKSPNYLLYSPAV